MAQINIADSVGDGYRTVWAERQYILRLAIAPLLLKFICWNLIASFGWEMQFVRQALIMLPSFFADGWMAAHLVRYVFYNQTWPFKPSGRKEIDLLNLQDRATGIMAGTVSYVLIQFLITGSIAFSQNHLAELQGLEVASNAVPEPPTIFEGGENETQAEEAVPLSALVAFFALTMCALWSFRYVFLYIPAAANLKIRDFYKKIKGLNSSVYLIAIWLICFFPVFMILRMFFGILLEGHPANTNFNDLPLNIRMFLDVLRIVGDLSILTLATLSISFAIKRLYVEPQKDNKNQV